MASGTRITYAFSKKVENHALSVALHYMHYNLCRIHKTLRVTPAMAAGASARGCPDYLLNYIDDPVVLRIYNDNLAALQ
jgi:hypothetical protein